MLWLQELTSRYLEQLSSGTTLTLAAFRPATKSGAAEIERITKVALNTALNALKHALQLKLQVSFLTLLAAEVRSRALI